MTISSFSKSIGLAKPFALAASLRITCACCLVLFCCFLPSILNAQCVGLPSITSLGSNKFPVGLCAPVQANVTYTVAFAAPVEAGQFELVYDWGDGTIPETVSLMPGSRTYNASLNHTYPAESDCEYFVTMAIRYKGKICTNTNQIQKISSWRTDAFNGGHVSLVSPTTKTNVHLVCEGEDIAVTFDDKTNWNCNGKYQTASLNPIESPNTEYRWQQIVYNTPVEGNKIPNIKVDGVAMTNAGGSDLTVSYQDPRGVFYMSAPVLENDSRRRPSLKITAPGGFGTGFPKSGDVFEVTLRYWNFCNPYDDPEIPGAPVDAVNGDHPPVEKTALIRVLAPPPPLTGTDETVCLGTTPSAFAVSGLASGNIVSWYRYVAGSDEPGEQIASGKQITLPVTAHPEWTDNSTAGSLKVWATQRTNTSDATNCESSKVLVTRTIRENLSVPVSLSGPPAEICNGQSFSIILPAPGAESTGGATKYVWTLSAPLSVTSTTANSITVNAQAGDFQGALWIDTRITVERQYVNAPACAQATTFEVRIYSDPEGGTLSGIGAVCETDAVGPLQVTGYAGAIDRWEVKKDDGAYARYDGEASGNTITPGVLTPGSYHFRAVIVNGPCKEAYSNELKVVVAANPEAAFAGDDQFICSALQSAALNANSPDVGSASWSYVKSLPAGLPVPTFEAGNPNTTVVISPENAGVYTLRWTATNGSCSGYDDVVVDFGTNPSDPDAGADRSVCGPSAILDGNVPVKGLATWTIVDGPGCAGGDCPVSISSSDLPQAAVTLTGAKPRYGAYTFRWNISSGGNNCFLKTDDVTLTFEEPVMIEAPDVNNNCLASINPEPIELTGTVTGPVFSTAWSNVSGNGIVTVSSESLSSDKRVVTAYYHPTSADYVSGAPVKVKLIAMPANAFCHPEEKVITISFQRKPVADAGADIKDICDAEVQLGAATPLYGAPGQWTTQAPGVLFDDVTDPETTVRNLPIGTTLATWTVSAGSACAAQSSSITLTRVPLPEVVDVHITECAVQPGLTSVVLAGYEDVVTTLAGSVREIAWFKVVANGGEEPVADVETAQSNVVNGQQYIARVRDVRTHCTNDAVVTVAARPLPMVMNAAISRCESITGSNIISGLDLSDARFTTAITTSPDVMVAWYFSEADAEADRFPIVAPVAVNGQKAFFAKVTWQTAPTCFSIGRLDMVVTPQPAIANIAGRESVCQATSSSMSNDLPVHVYQVMPVAGARYHWDIPDEPGHFIVFGGGGERDFYVLLQFPNVYTGKISVSAEINGCSGPVIEKEIAVSAAPAMPVIDGTSFVCENNNHIAFGVSPDNFPSSAYNWEVRRVSDNSVGGAYITEGQLTGNVLVNFGEEDVIISVRENNAECVSPVAMKVIKVMDPPKATLVVEKEPSCFMAADGAVRTEVVGGTAPFSEFEIVETRQKDSNNDGVFENLPQGVYSVRLKDANGCFATTDVQKLEGAEVQFDVDFAVEQAARECGGGEYTFTWEAQAGIDYRWEWGDGTTSALPADAVVEGKNRLTHSFAPVSSVNSTTYAVRLFGSYKGCAEKVMSRPVVLAPAIRLSVLAGDTALCSGETITFYDNSSGVDTGRWYYRVPGGPELSQSTTARERNPSFTLHNTTSRNPIVYEVVYEAQNNAGCGAVYSQQVVVYRASEAAFEVGPVPSFESESVKVEVTNTSTVLDVNQFRYTWNYGAQGTAQAASDSTPFDIIYYSPGRKEISLSVVNIGALEAHKLCQTVYRETIDIPVRALRAAFTATPFASCFPVTIAAQNESAGADLFFWKVLREGAIVSTSNLRYPEFRITEPGVYDIELTASVSATGEEAQASVRGLEVYDAPKATFEIRTDRLYVPDQEMEVFNFSRRASYYEWYFGDGSTADAFEPTHSYAEEGRYAVVLFAALDHGFVDSDGDGTADRNLVCYDSARREVVAMLGGAIEIPNAFTPDVTGPSGGRATAGGFNDVFLPVVKGATAFHMYIYDRWGTLVFQSNDKDIGWDGYDRNQRLMPAGVYIYKIELVQSNGETITRAGDVSLIR